MTSLAQINDTQVSIISFKSIPVLTTAMLAQFYGTEPIRIQQNQHENKQRFSGLASETVCHANMLNRKAIGYGITNLEHVGNPPHSMEWYLS